MKESKVLMVSSADIIQLIERIQTGTLSKEETDKVTEILWLLIRLIETINEKNISIARLKRLLFGPKSEKRNKSRSTNDPVESINNPTAEEDRHYSLNGGDSAASLEREPVVEPSTPDAERERKPGHGRIGQDEYSGAREIYCQHSTLKPGDKCPNEFCKGQLYDTKEPQILIKREARPVIDAIKYQRQVLRCSRCGERFAAALPEKVSEDKYETSADVMIAILHYWGAMPFYRLEQMQSMMNVPLPASNQFERVEAVANCAHPIYLEMERQAAGSGLLHTDDTTVKILALMEENKHLSETDRKGMYTTGVGARSTTHEIALFFSGRKYSGENLSALLKKRNDDLTEPIIMGDALSRNWVKDYKAIVAKCLAHGRRQFVDIEVVYPAECKKVLIDLGEIYKNDAKTKGMTVKERLAYHQEHSKPIMDDLYKWIDEMLTERKVQPNSSLGKALTYMRRHREGLTRFLSIEGCPIDNNHIERALRRSVLLRKNSLFFRSEHGAAIADVLLSIIETCNLNKVNPFEYLMAIMKNARDVRQRPDLWLPWTYNKEQKTISKTINHKDNFRQSSANCADEGMPL